MVRPFLRRRGTPAAARAAAAVAVIASQHLGAQHSLFPFERMAEERGLSNGTVTAIAQDARGFLWFGTQDGLNLYDGTTFRVYRPVPGDSTSLGDAWITALSPSRGHGLWVATLHGGVQRALPGAERFRRFEHSDKNPASLATNDINTVLEARNGAVWVGTAVGLDVIDTTSGRVRHFLPTAHGDSAHINNDVLSLAELPGGGLWVGTRRGAYAFDPRAGRFEPLQLGLRTREILALLTDADGVVWVGTKDDLVQADGRTRTVRRRFIRSADTTGNPAAAGVNALARDAGGTIWVGSDNGLVSLDPVTGHVARYTPSNADPRSLGGPIVRSVRVDRGGVLWVGIESHGLSKHAPAQVTFDLLRDNGLRGHSLSDGYVRGIAQDRRGNVWIGTQNGGLDRIDARTGLISAFRHRAGNARSLPGDDVWGFLEDHAGTTWVGLHVHGLGTFDPNSGAFRPFALVPTDASVNVLYEDREHRLYVGIEGRGLYEIAPDRRSVHTYGATFGERRVLATDDVQSVLEDRDGLLWVGGALGLTQIDRATGRALHFVGTPGRQGNLSNSFVTNIVQDRHGTIWVATKGGGLNRFDSPTHTFTTFGTAQGLPHSFIYGILEDRRGGLWLSSDDGIARFDPYTGAVTRYGLADGLQAREFNRRAHYRAEDGTMYFGGINGLNIFNPDAVAPAPPPPVVSFVALDADGVHRSAVNLSADSSVHLAHDASAFTISFAALDYTAPEKIRYAYKLDGVDRQWVLAGDRHQATYASLPTGQHRFLVIAATPFGVWSTRGVSVTFVVTPPWWNTWWARIVWALALAGLVTLVIRIRMAAAHRANARQLLDMTAAVPGAVFQLRDKLGGERDFVFVSEGIARLFPDRNASVEARADPRAAARRLFERIEPADRAAVETSLAATSVTLDSWRGEMRWTPFDGAEVRWVAVQAQPARQLDGVVVWTGVMTDATESRRAERERVALESKMLQAQKAESLAVLAGGVAHDFNNVLVSVVVGAELLRYQIGDNEVAASTVRRIRTAGNRAAELTKQMLAYAGKGRLTVQRVDLGKLVDEMVSLVRATIPSTIALDLDLDSEPVIVEADATQLRQVVMNLVTNAGEAIGDKNGRVAVRVGVEHTAARDLTLLHSAADIPAVGPYAVLDVSDTGVGMGPELLARIFDPFFTTKFAGRGLGLAALLGIVRGHHGGVKVITAPGTGTRFQLYFPIATGAEAAQVPAEWGIPEQTTARQRVLVADDEEDVRHIARGLLEVLGYEVVVAEDGAAALETATADSSIDVILLDMTMPRMTGPAAAEALRARGVTTPIILMSGYAEEELVTRGIHFEADGFLKKPFQGSELAALIRDALGARAER